MVQNPGLAGKVPSVSSDETNKYLWVRAWQPLGLGLGPGLGKVFLFERLPKLSFLPLACVCVCVQHQLLCLFTGNCVSHIYSFNSSHAGVLP